jgi:methionyl-tRNA formyltransferase
MRGDESGDLILTGGKDVSTAAAPRLRICLCSDRDSWINQALPELICAWIREGHDVTWVHSTTAAPDGDICFYLSYSRIVGADALARFQHNLVVHASALPHGRGWSPLTWQIIEGASAVPITLFEAAPDVDSGVVYRQIVMEFDGTELIDELRKAVSRATRDLCRHFVAGYPATSSGGTPQVGEPTFYARRRPEDSHFDIDRPLREQFNLLRTVDPECYPAWFDLHGVRYGLTVWRLPQSPLDDAAEHGVKHANR